MLILIRRTLFILISLCALFVTIEACTCSEEYRPVSLDLVRADAVFLGRVVSVSEIPRKRIIRESLDYDLITTFRIEKRFKGLRDTEKLISLTTNYQANSCGFRVDDKPKPKAGQTWIVFGRRWDGLPQLHLTGTCGRSKVLRFDESKVFYEEALGDVKVPAIAVSIIRHLDRIKEFEVSVKGGGLEYSATPDKNGQLVLYALRPGMYTVEVLLPIEAKISNEAFWNYTYTETKARIVDGGKTLLTYNLDLQPNSYHYNEIYVTSIN